MTDDVNCMDRDSLDDNAPADRDEVDKKTEICVVSCRCTDEVANDETSVGGDVCDVGGGPGDCVVEGRPSGAEVDLDWNAPELSLVLRALRSEELGRVLVKLSCTTDVLGSADASVVVELADTDRGKI